MVKKEEIEILKLQIQKRKIQITIDSRVIDNMERRLESMENEYKEG